MLRIYLLLGILVLFWSLNLIFTKVALVYMPPVWLTFVRFFIAVIALFAFLSFQGKLKLPNRRDLPMIFSIGILQMGIFQLLITYGLAFVDAGRASILIYSMPLWVTPLAIIFFQERLTKLKLLGLIAGIAGILVLFSPGSFDWSDKKVIIGNGLLLLGSVCWAIALLHSRYGKWHREPIDLIAWQLFIGAIPSLILAPLTESFSRIHWNWVLIATILYNGIIATAFGYWASITISRKLPAVTSSLSLLAVPVLSLFFSALFLGEKLTASDIIAAGLIIVGLVCIVLENRIPRQRDDILAESKTISQPNSN